MLLNLIVNYKKLTLPSLYRNTTYVTCSFKLGIVQCKSQIDVSTLRIYCNMTTSRNMTYDT